MGVEALIIGAAVGAGAGALLGREKQKDLERQATIERSNARQQAELIRGQVGELKTAQKSAFIASGLDLSGSPLLLLQDTLTRGEQQAQAAIETGEKKGRALERRGRREFISSIFQIAGAGTQLGGEFA